MAEIELSLNLTYFRENRWEHLTNKQKIATPLYTEFFRPVTVLVCTSLVSATARPQLDHHGFFQLNVEFVCETVFCLRIET